MRLCLQHYNHFGGRGEESRRRSARSTPSTTTSESTSGNSRSVRKTNPKLSPNEQPQGPLTEDQYACQNYD
jgi:hypothetical protein